MDACSRRPDFLARPYQRAHAVRAPVESAKTDNVFLDMQVPPMFEEDAGVSRDTVLFAAEEMALFFRAVGKTFLILLAAVLGVGLVSAGAGGARFSSSSPNRSDATGFSWRSGR